MERHLQAVTRTFFAPRNDATVWRDGWYGKTAQLQTEAANRTDFSQIYFGGTAPALEPPRDDGSPVSPNYDDRRPFEFDGKISSVKVDLK